MTAGVLVFNAGGDQFLHRVDFQHAVRMLYRGKAVVHVPDPHRPPIGRWPWPKALALVRYVYTRWMYGRPAAWSKRGVLARDDYRCGYCGAYADTVDHIVPKARGGRDTWLNTVAACDRCNQAKGDRTLRELRWQLRTQPFEPSAATAALAAATR